MTHIYPAYDVPLTLVRHLYRAFHNVLRDYKRL